jgi:raffinose/stachyose/melibiose transport system substrate-binding protein
MSSGISKVLRLRSALALGIAALSVAALAATGSASSGGAGGARRASATASNCAASSGKTTGGGKVTLTLWDWGSPGKALTSLVKQWNTAHPKIQVNQVVQPFNTYFTLERTAITTKKGPDIVENYTSPIVFSYSQGLQNLTGCFTQQQRSSLSQWNLISQGLSQNGAPLAVPWGQQNVVFYYNKALFKKAGLNPSKPPQTWAELLKDSAKLKHHGIVPISAGWKDGYYGEWWASVFAPQFMTAAQQTAFIRHPNWTSKPVTTSLSYMDQLSKDGYMTPNALGLTLFPQAIDNFHAGKAAMVLALSANNANFSEFASMGNKLGAFLPPVLPGTMSKEPRMEAEGGVSWGITKWSPHAAAALQFLKFLVQANSQATAFKLSAMVPNDPKTKVSAPNGAGAQIMKWVGSSNQYLGVVDIAFLANVEPAYDKVIPEIVNGSLSPQAAMQQVQSAQQQAPPIPGLG